MKKRYIVQAVEGFNGLEFLTDNPNHRRIYGPGEIVELDDTIHNVAAIKASGIVIEAPEEKTVVVKNDDG